MKIELIDNYLALEAETPKDKKELARFQEHELIGSNVNYGSLRAQGKTVRLTFRLTPKSS